MNHIMLTQNTDKLRLEVATHVAADTIAQGNYWDSINNSGCWIGCLAKSNDPYINEVTYGLPVMVQRIAEKIFEALPAAKAKAFFAALPDAVNCDGKDLTKVGWQFLAAELRSLPNCSDRVQSVIDPVITGMDLLASGQEWADVKAAATVAADTDAAYAARVADAVVQAATWAADAADWPADPDAVRWASDAAAAWAAACAASGTAAVRLRQRDLLLRLISQAPVVEAMQ